MHGERSVVTTTRHAWVRRVLRNLAANHARHLRLAPTPPSIENVSAPTTDRLAMIAALAQLPAPQREALVLHDGLGVPVAEVASELGVPGRHGAVLAQPRPSCPFSDPQCWRRHKGGHESDECS